MTATKKVIVLGIAAVLVAGVSGVYAKGLFQTSNKTQIKMPDNRFWYNSSSRPRFYIY